MTAEYGVNLELPTMSHYNRPNLATNLMRQHLIEGTRIQTSDGHPLGNVRNVLTPGRHWNPYQTAEQTAVRQTKFQRTDCGT